MILGYELPEAGLSGPPPSLVSAARRAETAGVDFLVLGDRPVARPGGAGPPAAIVAASLLAVNTTRIGLVMSAATAYYEPYNLARMVASLDHISGGRAGWQVITGPDESADTNHRREGVDPAVGRDARAAEFVPLVRDLWDTWEDGAFVHDKTTGQFIDGDRIHTLNHEGPTLRVRGPLNLVRPPQGQPVVLAPATEPLIASAADVLTVGNPDSGAIAADPGTGDRRVLGVVTPFVAGTQALARALHEQSGAPRSDPSRAVLVGDGTQVADRLADWVDRGVVDGFTLRFSLPAHMAAFSDLVLPRLRAAGRFRTAYSAVTLRGHLGLPKPANRIAGRTAAAVGAERS